MDEVARSCYDILADEDIPENKRMYEFQKTIHQKETQRIKESIIEKEK
jgi:hypothetical protein